MQEDTYLLLGGDDRFDFVLQGLRKLALRAERDLGDSDDWQERVSGVSVVVLPLPAFRPDGTILGTKAAGIQSLCRRLAPGQTVLGGMLEPWETALRNNGAQVIDYYQDELLLTDNAILTAEGAIQLAMEQLPISIWSSRMLVVGAGRIGMALAEKLKALGSHVTVSARRPRDWGRIRAAGMRGDRTLHYAFRLEEYDAVFNTVPAPVFTPEHYAALRRDCLLLELASAPGGIDREQCAHRRLFYCAGSGLPGKTAPRSAGTAICDAIIRARSGAGQQEVL